MSSLHSFALALLATVLSGSAVLAQSDDEAKPTPDQLAFFEKKIRPVLADSCYKCHSEKSEKIKGGLILDTREGIRRGGDNGPAVVPGEPKESLLLEAVRYTNKDFAMPPEKNGGKLPDAVIQDFETWIAMGAPDPRDGVATVVKKYDAELARKWWSFQPVQKPAAPAVKDAAWPRGAIDQHILAGLEAKGIKPVGDADKLTLLRRVYFDLIGLPPAPAEIDAFLRDAAPDAFAKVVDRLLASPQFGERWGRHWLDVARYAESTGKDVNVAYPHAWRFRDYVIAAFNADKPYDQFVREQIAGDLLPAANEAQRAEQLVATGFLAVGTKSLNERDPRQFAVDVADEQIDTMSQAVLGLTVACARCHDHKFDPIPQREYYAMAGIFLSTETRYGTPGGIQNRHPSSLIELPAAAGAKLVTKTVTPEMRKRLERQLSELKNEQQELNADLRKMRRSDGPAGPGERPQITQREQQRRQRIIAQIGQLEALLGALDQDGQPRALAMGVQDRAEPPRAGGGLGQRFREGMRARLGRRAAFTSIADSPLFARGEVDKPGERVPRSVLTLFAHDSEPQIDRRSSGRRELATWLTAPENPLTARVMTNRMWHWLFGQGLVESVDNFGTTGQRPSNPALLDHLATRLVENGWSMKKTIREIVLSRTYQLGSSFDERSFAADPENQLVWRQDTRRLDAECIRDAMLAAAGALDLRPPIGSAIALAGDGVLGRRRLSGVSEDTLVDAESTARSVYLAVARDILPDALAVFDFAEPSLVTGARETTNVPAQALYLLNSSFATSQAQKFAARILAAHPGGPNGGVTANLEPRLAAAYWTAFGRAPSAGERRAAATFFSRFPSNWSKDDKSAPGLLDAADTKAAWTSFCRALFATAEFRYLN